MGVKKPIIINTNELIVKSKNKLGRYLPEVSRGSGKHKSIRDYNRKRDKINLKKQLERGWIDE